MYNPVEIHYDEVFKQNYLYYEFGNHSFHAPVDDIDAYKNLPVKKLNYFESSNEDLQNMYCERFCEFVMEKLEINKNR